VSPISEIKVLENFKEFYKIIENQKERKIKIFNLTTAKSIRTRNSMTLKEHGIVRRFTHTVHSRTRLPRGKIIF